MTEGRDGRVRKDHALGVVRLDGRAGDGVVALVSLVSVWGGNWCYLCGTVETVAECETLEIINVHAVITQVAENMVGWPKSQGEYPTLSASSVSHWFSFP